MRPTPTFTGRRAVVLHRADPGIDRLVRQLVRLGLDVDVRWQRLEAERRCDVVLVDADQGWSGLLPWEGGDGPVPVVALLASEAPGRVAWAMENGAVAIIAKPIAASAVYPALVLATSLHAERQAIAERLARLEERIRMRPLVHAGVKAIMAAHRVDEERAYTLLRAAAMRRRLTMEQVAAAIVAGAEPLPEAG
jgi:AmiR/NasT family two-component response regulator